MKRQSGSRFLLLAFFLIPLPLPASGFTDFLSHFVVTTSPVLLGSSTHGGEEISIDDFESFVLAPGLSLSGSRSRLQGLEDWGPRIARYRLYLAMPHGPDDFSMSISITPLGRWEANGTTVLAISCALQESWVDGGDSWSDCYLLSYSGAGRLLDGFAFLRSGNEGFDGLRDFRDMDPGFGDIAVDADGGIHSVQENGAWNYDEKGYFVFMGEIWIRDLLVGATGRFALSPTARVYQLSRVLTDAGESPGRLFIYETEKGGSKAPLFVAWRNDKKGESFEAELPDGLPQQGQAAVRCLSGETMSVELSDADATLVDPSGVTHKLTLAYGPGRNGEETQFSGLERIGDPNSGYHDRAWSYLFAPASRPLPGSGGQALFAARSFVFGPIHLRPEGQAAVDPDAVAVGAPVAGFTVPGPAATVALAPGGQWDFDSGRANGTLIRDTAIAAPRLSVQLPAGTRYGGMEGSWGTTTWVLLPKDAPVVVAGIKVTAPGGTLIRWDPAANPTDVDFPAPVTLRAGPYTISAWSLHFNLADLEVTLAQDLTVTVHGKKAVFTDRVEFDSGWIVTSGRLAADTDLIGGGRTLRIRGGRDPEDPKRGTVAFWDGSLLNGFLAADAVFRAGKAVFTLGAGSYIEFSVHGDLYRYEPDGMVVLSAGGRRFFQKTIDIGFGPDGSIGLGYVPEEIKDKASEIRVSPLYAASTTANLRVRQGPDVDAAILGSLAKGDKVAVLDRSAEQATVQDMTDYWYRVRRLSDGLTGWSFGHYLKMEE